MDNSTIYQAIGRSDAAGLAFDSFGVLEHILSYADTDTLLEATRVNRRWKDAGRSDSLWKATIARVWEKKSGVEATNPLFWRALLSKDAIKRMSVRELRSVFKHSLLKDKEKEAKRCLEKSELQRLLQVHMLDVVSDGMAWHRFFPDIYFGSYACSVLDSKRESITPVELCTPHGYDMYFKVSEDEVDDGDQSRLAQYDGAEGILLYHHSTCYFDENRDFQLVPEELSHSYHPSDLKWRWVSIGRQVQVGPYPPLTVSRRENWGWKLENLHVVLFFRDSPK